MANNRFVRIYGQGIANICEIWVDQETGVNYLYLAAGNGAGLTPLLDQSGKPVITAVIDKE